MTMPEIRSAVLSDQLQLAIGNRRVRSAVFLTYKYDPAFFEQEVLPVLFDERLNNQPAVRLVQLDNYLRSLSGEIAVYYDVNGLVTETGSAKLDTRRIPVRCRNGIFHPKNIFLLLEERSDDGTIAETLAIVTLSANLTKAGWWRNIEAAHIETLAPGERTRLRNDAIAFLNSVKRRAHLIQHHDAIDDIIAFLKRTEQRVQRSSGDVLHTHFYGGGQTLTDFIDEVAGARVHGACLEVLSPYFDQEAESAPLKELIRRFNPKEVRVLLPRAPDGTGQCPEELHDWLSALPGAAWGRLTGEITRGGKSQNALARIVHAKIYRFFHRSPSREIIFVGSVNLTRPAHQGNANVESGVLVERRTERRADFWLKSDDVKPAKFEAQAENEGAATMAGSRLSIRFNWQTKDAEAFWDDQDTSPALILEGRNVVLGTTTALPPRAWINLPSAIAAALKEILIETSIVSVRGDRSDPVALLVQEEAMSHKPSLLLTLSVADILRYWSLMTDEERAAFIEQRPELQLPEYGADLIAKAMRPPRTDTFFDRFAGIFHAFGSLERKVREALTEGNEREAKTRLFGAKYDSLPTLLDKLANEVTPAGDGVDHYVTLLSAKEMLRALKRDHAEFWQEHKDDVQSIERKFDGLESIRQRLIAADPAEMTPFLAWFETWFLERAKPAAPIK